MAIISDLEEEEETQPEAKPSASSSAPGGVHREVRSGQPGRGSSRRPLEFAGLERSDFPQDEAAERDIAMVLRGGEGEAILFLSRPYVGHVGRILRADIILKISVGMSASSRSIYLLLILFGSNYLKILVTCLLERLRGAASASEPRMQKSIYEMGFSILNSTLILLEVYKHESAVIYLLLKFVVEWVEGQITYLEAQETTAVIDYCMRLLQLYSSHNIGKISLSLSSSLLSDAKTEKYKDLRALLQLLSSLCSKDLVDFSSDSLEAHGTSISQVVFYGLHIVTPLISLELLTYPKLCHDYFSLLSHMLEVYPEMVGQLNNEAFSHILETLEFGLHHQDSEVVNMCLRALRALASYHYKETASGKMGLGSHHSNFN
ncbi:hypothetical protein NL676_018355 [Syzygium grande]|nr:hypothetical protein NL676_018355 [Syzygium grande]